jgi:hypothetical protein
VWFDPKEHLSITKKTRCRSPAKEAVVVYAKGRDGARSRRRVVEGPAVFVPEPGEWLHTFSWHGSRRAATTATSKVPNALVFQKLWLLPDQMYHDVSDVRTADDAVLTIRLMLFFELVDLERMLASRTTPSATSSTPPPATWWTSRESTTSKSFKRHTEKLNELERVPAARLARAAVRLPHQQGGLPRLRRPRLAAARCTTRPSSRARDSQLERATLQQAQELEDFTQERSLVRGERLRADRAAETDHEIAQGRRRREADLEAERARQTFLREQQKLDADQDGAITRAREAERRAHLAALRELGVDLTALLTQSRADQVIELRGGAEGAHVHLQGKA